MDRLKKGAQEPLTKHKGGKEIHKDPVPHEPTYTAITSVNTAKKGQRAETIDQSMVIAYQKPGYFFSHATKNAEKGDYDKLRSHMVDRDKFDDSMPKNTPTAWGELTEEGASAILGDFVSGKENAHFTLEGRGLKHLLNMVNGKDEHESLGQIMKRPVADEYNNLNFKQSGPKELMQGPSLSEFLESRKQLAVEDLMEHATYNTPANKKQVETVFENMKTGAESIFKLSSLGNLNNLKHYGGDERRWRLFPE